MAESSFLNPTAVLRAAGLHESLRVADFDAGAGFFTRAAARMCFPGEVWAVDAQAEVLPRIKNLAVAEGLTNVEVVRGNVEHLGGSNLPDTTFDFCIIANTLFTLECKACCAAEAARILKRHGKVLVVDWKGSFGGLGPAAHHVIAQEDARAVFEEAGFSFVGNVPAGGYHWGCILQKA
jgi:ubiquinone/menaquinone biosynthesis C-methylase UbiE